MDNQRNIIVGLGEALWDMLPEGKKIGGAPANFAYHVAQFGFKSCVVSAVGNDELGDEIINSFKAKSLNMIIPRVDYPTGTVQVTLDEKGIPCYEIKEGVAWDNIPYSEQLDELASNTCAVCFGSLAQRNGESRKTIETFIDKLPDEGVLKIFDINLRQHFYSLELIDASLNRCNILKINDEELEIISKLLNLSSLNDTIEKKCEELINHYNLSLLILTCGVGGSYVISKNEKSFLSTPLVDVVDTVGAGDSFTGAFTASRLVGKSISESHKAAVDISAFVCTCAGAMPELPEKLKGRFV